MAQRRGGVIIIEDDQVALIQRVNARGTYFLFPGGGVEAGETVAEAAVREAWEELGVEVQLAGLAAVVEFGPNEQHYYLAHTWLTSSVASLAVAPVPSCSPMRLHHEALIHLFGCPGAACMNTVCGPSR